MKKAAALLLLLSLLFCTAGCTAAPAPAQIAATTLPVYDFTLRLCKGTGLSVTRVINDSVSCLHDYSLSVRQVQALEAAQAVVLSGGGLEAFMEDVLSGCKNVIDSAQGIELLSCEDGHDHQSHHHHHEADAHLWLSPSYAKSMVQNICAGLSMQFPEHKTVLEENLSGLLSDLDQLQSYGQAQLSALSCRELITFHDGFSYFANAFDLTILEAVEEESGSEASAQELKHLCYLVQEHQLPAIFTERSGSVSAASVISAETGTGIYSLDMAMAEGSYFDAMYHNIDTIKEALG